jgi:precorrin-8X/cobalt-precorrin-8 methylmutase
MSNYLNDPMGIEKKSFEIIEKEIHQKGEYDFASDEWMVVKRVIHTTADFEYADLIRFKNSPILSCMDAIKSGCKIYTDTNMIRAGINKRKLTQFGCELVNFVSDDDVRKRAKELGVTRSTVSMMKACEDESIRIFLIGNAPTALFTLMELIDSGIASPDVIVGVPVGFVGASESKKQLLDYDVPSISIQGRKGGSTVAVSIINAIFYLLDNNR